MPPKGLFRDALYVLYHEALRSPWICLSALGVGPEDSIEEAPGPSGDAVLVLGGFLSHPLYYAPLGRIIRRRGHIVHFDDVFNALPFREHVGRLADRVDRLADAHGSPIRIVGHSLGGLHAMALLLERPAAVGQVIAIASPVAGGTPWRPLQRLAERVLRLQPRDASVLPRRLTRYAERITTISSPQDLVAPPASCAVAGSANVVLSTLPRSDRSLASHGGVVFMRTAVRVVLATLERPLGGSGATRWAV